MALGPVNRNRVQTRLKALCIASIWSGRFKPDYWWNVVAVAGGLIAIAAVPAAHHLKHRLAGGRGASRFGAPQAKTGKVLRAIEI
jgi:hypothetical protein